MQHTSILSALLTFGLAFGAHAQGQLEPILLEVSGQVTDGTRKMPGCSIVIYDGNEVVGQQLTTKSGNFGFALGLGKEFAVVFSKEGFQAKSILIDTRAKLPADMYAVAPLGMDLSLLPADKYSGVDTDVLDFPYAMVKWDKRAMAFVQDQQYTSSMMRTNGALLLQAGRATK